MKKLFSLFLAFCMVVSGCQVNEMYEEEVLLDHNDVFHASIDGGDSTKTTLDEDRNIRWSKEDQLIIFKKSTLGLKYQLQDEYAGLTSGYFSKVISGTSSDDFGAGTAIEHNIAYYPYSQNVKFNKSGANYTLKVAVPSEQNYVNNSFGNDAFHMAAVSEDSDLTFKNVFGCIKFLFKGVGKVMSVKIEGKNDEKISGDAVVTVYPDDQVPEIVMDEEASTTVTLNCGSGVQLNEAEATAFIISLPPTEFSKGFTVTVTDPQGNEEVVETDNSFIVTRSGLHIMKEKTLTVIEPEDFSTNLSENGTANSYIVSSAGEYRFTPTKGNSSQSVGSIASVEVLWETYGTDVAPASGDLINNVRFSGKYVRFETPEVFKEGNALIAAKDASNNILWSWHIWLTDKPAEHTYNNNAGILMDRNLGATSATPGDAGALGLYYQWGRKDPFLNSYSNFVEFDVKKVAASTGEWYIISSSQNVGTVAYATKNPTTFIKGENSSYNDWVYSYSLGNRWDTKKTMYDPCPAGWRVPDGGNAGMNGTWALVGFVNASADAEKHGVTLDNVSGAWYPAAGYCSWNNAGTMMYSVGSYGRYWTVSPANNNAYALDFGVSPLAVNTSYKDGYRSYAYSVRCYKEGSEGSPSPSQGTPKDGDYVDANGINHGQGITIDGTTWAPVNVGATSSEKYGSYFTWIDAHQACPEGWRLPNKTELQTLAQNTQDAAINGVNGKWCAGSKTIFNSSTSIFLPAAGNKNGNVQHNGYGYYWSSSAATYREQVSALYFEYEGSAGIRNDVYATGQYPVRCVRMKADEEVDIDGLIWATKNIGAASNTENGSYYQSKDINKACPNGWRVPTFDDMRALKQNYSEIISNNSVSGRWFSGSNTVSNAQTGIFLPISGYQYESNDGTKYNTTKGWYWTSTLGGSSYWYLSLEGGNSDLGIGTTRSTDAVPIRCVKGEYNGPALQSAPGANTTSVILDGVEWDSKNLGANSIEDNGNVYSLEEAKIACPEGWRLPTKSEFENLIVNHTWDKVTSKYGILCRGNQNSQTAAIFLPAESSSTSSIMYTRYWTSTEYVSNYRSGQYVMSMSDSGTSLSAYTSLEDGIYVRCVKINN